MLGPEIEVIRGVMEGEMHNMHYPVFISSNGLPIKANFELFELPVAVFSRTKDVKALIPRTELCTNFCMADNCKLYNSRTFHFLSLRTWVNMNY